MKINNSDGPQIVAQLLAQLMGTNEEPEQDSILARAENAPPPYVGLSRATRWREPVHAVIALMNREQNPYTRAEAQNWVREDMGLNEADFILLKAAVSYRLNKESNSKR